MLKPLQEWVCDSCGKIIEKPDDGYIQWLVDLDDDFKYHGFRIEHHPTHSPRKPHNNCYLYHHSTHNGINSESLKEFIDDCPARLLFFLDIGPYHEKDYKGPHLKDIREFVELMRRLTIPYYEEARLYWNEAINDHYFDGDSEIVIYLPETLKTLVEEYSN